MKVTSVTLCFLLAASTSHSQTSKDTVQTLTGCVARIPTAADKYVIAVDDRCMLLTGSYDATQIADHRITVRGLVTEADGMLPLTLNVQSVKATLAACTKTCVLEPPGTRGVHGRERPGTEGGTPGLHPQAEHPQ